MKKEKKRKEKRGRPRTEIDYETLEALCICHNTGEDCAFIMGINYTSLNGALKRDGHKSFPDYFNKHSAGGRAKLRKVQFEIALGGSERMLIHLGGQYLDQKDRKELDHTSTDGTMSPPTRIEIVALKNDDRKD